MIPNGRSNMTEADLIYDKAHKLSMMHRGQIMESSLCGCFYCLYIFPKEEIEEWIDSESKPEGETALCPKCGIDAVIGDKSGFDISKEFLTHMNLYWFS